MIVAPKTATPTVLGGGHHISNLIPTTGSEVQTFTAESDSDVISSAISGANENDLTYLELRKNLPKNQDNTLGIPTIIEEIKNLHEFIIIEIAKINTPRALFTPVHELDPMELAGGETTPTKTLPDDDKMPPLLI